MNAIENLLGAQLVDGQMQPVSVQSITGAGKIVGLYFSAHWCPPCRSFTPKLAAFYEMLKISLPEVFEIVFVSSDQDENQWNQYFAEMPWLALPFKDRDRKQEIWSKYGVSGIPTLILLDGGSGEVINEDAGSDVEHNPDGNGFPWKK